MFHEGPAGEWKTLFFIAGIPDAVALLAIGYFGGATR